MIKATGDGYFLIIASVQTLYYPYTADSRMSKTEYNITFHNSDLPDLKYIISILLKTPLIRTTVSIPPVRSRPI